MSREIPDYVTATNEAYSVLCNLHITSLPVPIFSIITQISTLRLTTYSKMCERLGLMWDELMSCNVSEKGYICMGGDKADIFYNDKADPEIIRFTLAHELGHYILRHRDESFVSDREANCFARNLLCPIPITDSFCLEDIGEICDVFDITPPAARVVLDKRWIDRMNTETRLYKSTSLLFGLPTLTKESQLGQYSERTIRAFAPVLNTATIATQ